mgnify:CR=1 FL=1
MGQPPLSSCMNGSFSKSLSTLRALARADKRFAREITLCSMFQLDDSLVSASPASARQQMPQNIFGFNMPAAAQGPSVVQGAALAESTLLGRITRYCVDHRDPEMLRLFGEAHRTPRTGKSK